MPPQAISSTVADPSPRPLAPSAARPARPATSCHNQTKQSAEPEIRRATTGHAGRIGLKANPSAPRPPAGPATENAPSVTLPLRFLVAGGLALLGAGVLLTLRPDLMATYHYNQHIIALTHLFVLGFALTTVAGAMYQMVPVALETALWSERLGAWHFPLHVTGVAGMVWTFWTWDMKWAGHWGSLLVFGAGLFIYNLVRTLRRSPHRDVVWYGIASVLGWLSWTLLAGLYLAASKCWAFSPFATIPAMHAHAHAGVLGVFVLLIVAVSYKLVPMFVLSRLVNERRAWWSLHLFNFGLAALFVGILLNRPWKIAAAGILVGGLVLYAVELRAVFRARLRRHLDWGLRMFLTGLSCLVPASIAGVVLCWPGLPATLLTTRLENVYGFLGLFGVVLLAILGMLYKIAPFLVWFHTYSDWVGVRPVPSLSDLYSTRLQVASFACLVPGLAGVAGASALGHETGVRAASAVALCGLALFALNMGLILRHWFHPRGHQAATPPSSPAP